MTVDADSLISLVVFVVVVGFQLAAQLWVTRRAPDPVRLRPHRRFKAFLSAVGDARRAGGQDLLGLSYAAQLRSGRRARVWFSRTGSVMQVRLCVSTAREVPPLRVRLETAIGRGVKEDIQTGDRAFDDRFFLQSTDPVAGARALGVELRRTITEAFTRKGVQRLVLKPGELSLEASVDALEPDQWKGLLLNLERAAALVETKPMNVRVLGGERDVVCDPEGKTRCAYCRDGITGDEPDLVACERCRTVLHDACWGEHGACPMLGCEGQAPERARVG